MKKYIFRAGHRVTGISAETAGKELERIRLDQGALTPPTVVEAARPKDAPLHPAFEWDNKTAAERYREHQARNLIRSVHVVTEARPEPAPAYVHVSSEEKPSYQPMELVVQSPDMFALALTELQRKMAGAMEAVRQLEVAAQDSDDADRLARVGIAIRAIETASDAIRALH